MRAVIIADFAAPSGGAQAVAILSAAALAQRGLDVTYIAGTAGPADERLVAARVDHVSLELQDVWTKPAPAAAAAGIWSREASRRLAAALSRLPPGPTILHLHQWTRSLSPSVFPVLLAAPFPLVVTLHDYFIACPTGVYYRFDQDEPCRLRPLSGPCLLAPCDPRSAAHKAVRVARTALTRLAVRRGGFDVVHVSDRGRDVVAPFLPRGLAQHRIDNPVDAERRPPARPGVGARVAFVGRLTREKGADLVAAAAVAAGMDPLFIGEGPAEEEIRRLAPRAELLGWRSPEETAALLRTRVLALAAPSRWDETGPLTVYEAMAAGIPPIVSRRAGAAEKVRDGETGLVVEPEMAALAAAFGAMSDPAQAERLGGSAYRAYWAAPLDPASHASRLEEVYRAVLARQG